AVERRSAGSHPAPARTRLRRRPALRQLSIGPPVWPMAPTLTFAIACLGIAVLVWVVLVIVFAPDIPYRVETSVDASSEHIIGVLEAACQTVLRPGNRIDILTNGRAFYPAMLEAIRGAEETVNMECYIFTGGDIARQFTAALSERARAGVRVTVVLDTFGS